MSEEQFVCAISGVAAEPAEDGELPVGWCAISVLVRRENSEWSELVQARNILIDQQLSQVPDDKREEARPLATILAKATLAALELHTPRFLSEEHEMHVSAEQLPALMELLGVEEA